MSNIQSLPQQETESRKTIFIIVGVVALLVIISALAFWLFTRSKSDAIVVKNETVATSTPLVDDVTKVVPNVPTADTSSAKKDSFDFLGTKFVFGWQGGDEKARQVMYEFYPEGETENTWTQIVTVVRNVGKKPTPEEAVAIFKTTMRDMQSKGAVIASQSEANDVQTAIFSFTAKNNAEVNIKKVFLYAGESIGITYGVRVNGVSESDAKQKVTDQVEKMKTIQSQFMSLRVPFLWESQKVVKKYSNNLSLVFQESGAGFTMKYPEGWDFKMIGSVFAFVGPTDDEGSHISVNVIPSIKRTVSAQVEELKKYVARNQGKVVFERDFSYSKNGNTLSGKDVRIEFLSNGKYGTERGIILPDMNDQSACQSWSIAATGKSLDLANNFYIKYADIGRQMLDSFEITVK